MRSSNRINRQFLLRLAVFLLPIMILFTGIEYGLSNILNSYSLKRALLSRQTTSEILVLGSSHAYYGINPEVWPVSGFNLANTSQDFAYDRDLYFRAIQKMPHLKVVILPVSYFSLWYSLAGNQDEYWREFFYTRFWGIIPDARYIPDLRNISLIALYSPEQTLSYIAQGLRVNLTDHINAWGAYREAQTKYVVINDYFGKERVIKHHSLMDDSLLKSNLRYIEEIINDAKRRGIKPVLVSTPLLPTYTAYMDPTRYREMQQIIAYLSNRYAIPYRDYEYDTRFAISDFVENDHLNENGADEFSRMLFDEMLKNLL